MKQPIIKCSSCRRGEIDQRAEFAVKGRLNGMPYRANLCEDHLDDIQTFGGLQVRSCRRIQPARVSAAMLREIYSKLCGTATLDAAGLAQIEAARQRYWHALIDEGLAIG